MLGGCQKDKIIYTSELKLYKYSELRHFNRNRLKVYLIRNACNIDRGCYFGK